MIDVVGHFGSKLSYATVTDQVAFELRSREKLANVMNLDDKFVAVEPFSKMVPRERGKKVVLIADPRDYLVDMLGATYGAENVAIFVCPNTNRLSDERLRACASGARVYTPSEWCRDTIENELDAKLRQRADVRVMPLGVDDLFGSKPPRENAGGIVRVLHVTTDTFWPGRKGTESLIAAWKQAPGDVIDVATLTIHCLPQLYAAIYQELADYELLDEVKLVRATEIRGSSDEDMRSLFRSHDLLVAPSRSEGFGIMPLSALVGGMPVLMTAGTGQDQYLGAFGALEAKSARRHPILRGWMQIPTFGSSELAGEDGEAPDVSGVQLSYALAAAIEQFDRLSEAALLNRTTPAAEMWSWKTRRAVWVDDLLDW